MVHTPQPGEGAIERLLERIASLEARVSELEARETPRSSPVSPASAADRYQTATAVLAASNEYSRQQRLQELREDPAQLALIRAARAQFNVFLVERGLPAQPDRYPELA